jgi:beta-N-acetylhexosaminidase
MSTLPVGELFVVGFQGHDVPASARTLLRTHQVGGVILFSRNIDDRDQVLALNQSLFDLSQGRSPILVSVDQEGGRVARLRHICTPIPPMRIIGEASRTDPELPHRLGAMMARELAALGFHWDFAPVVDVDTNPKNPVIGERSFASDPHMVAAVSRRFIEGMQGGGVAACAKHFPGHGDTDIDSHLDLPRLSHSMQRLNDVELVPFQAAIQAGVASIMTAHITFPALDQLPATLSKPILTGLLRAQLGFEGVVVSDDLEMAAVAERYPVEELVERGLAAGVDSFLICHDNDKAARAVEAAHRWGEANSEQRARVMEAVARMQQLKQRYVGAHAPPTTSEANMIVRSAPHMNLTAPLLAMAEARANTPQRADSLVDLA